MYGLYIKFEGFPQHRCVWQKDMCGRMPNRKPYGAKWQNIFEPVSSLLADTLPQCGMVLNECRSSHSLILWSLFFHLYPTAVSPISWMYYPFYSIHLLHTVVVVWSSSWYKLWWVVWDLEAPSTHVKPQISNHFGHLMWASAQTCVCVFMNFIIGWDFLLFLMCVTYILLFCRVSSHLSPLSQSTYCQEIKKTGS